MKFFSLLQRYHEIKKSTSIIKINKEFTNIRITKIMEQNLCQHLTLNKFANEILFNSGILIFVEKGYSEDQEVCLCSANSINLTEHVKIAVLYCAENYDYVDDSLKRNHEMLEAAFSCDGGRTIHHLPDDLYDSQEVMLLSVKVHKEGYKARNLTNTERAEIHALVIDANENPKEVAQMKKVALSMKPRSGRPKEYSDEMFISYITKYPTKSPKELHDTWKKDDPKNAPSIYY
eukprot:gene11031-3737_t